MSTDSPLPILGAVGSPYTRKLRAVCRYRRLPHVFIQNGNPESRGLPKPKVELMPQLILEEDGERKAMTDTTPLIRRLEESYPNERSVIPDDPALAFLDALVEDYGDEWITKAMFHYRWAYAADIDKAGAILPRWSMSQQPDEKLEGLKQLFSKRQIDRLWVVGSNEKTGPIIEASYERFLGAMENHLREHRFVLGNRPGSGDFGLYGQLTQLALFDPTPMETTLRISARTYAWAELVEDLSGLEPVATDWFARDGLPDTFRALLAEIGRVYPPFLLANAEALATGAEKVECEIDGEAYTQKPFPYQGKCLEWLRSDYAALSDSDRTFIDDTIAGTGLERLFA
ncbi:MAG: glutathione S-transferase [Deltaproteobacteria bacterium]|nr:glutathione S-transferase [Deltaproteobacteria bacterium]